MMLHPTQNWFHSRLTTRGKAFLGDTRSRGMSLAHPLGAFRVVVGKVVGGFDRLLNASEASPDAIFGQDRSLLEKP